ncbi:MAG: alkaline phosphatase family protein [Anaerolineales bacterium]
MHTLIIGLDAFDPGIVERMVEAGKLPHLSKFAHKDGYARFAVANPPQSEISWTSIATGLNPGGHGMFDFVHRDPASYALNVSLLPTKKSVLGTSFTYPHNAPTIFDQATQEGFPATALWWPATFPAHLASPVQNIPGLGTPDIHGRLGVGAAYSLDPASKNEKLKTPLESLKQVGRGRYSGFLKGPAQQKGNQFQGVNLEFQLDVVDDQSARLSIGNQTLTLTKGKWSPIFEIVFKLGFLASLHAITRVVMNQVSPEPSLYFLPLQIHPLHSPWPYATPPGFVRQTWNSCGSFLSLGWPQDTTGLEEKWITDDQFLQLCDSIYSTRRNIFLYHLKTFSEGLFASVFDSLDRVQHMFLRDRPDVIESWYQKFDELVGLAGQLVESKGWQDTRIIIVSDHGFTRFDHKVHLNRWLLEKGYITLKPGQQIQSLHSADWSQTQAYAVGLNSLYLNLQDRESQGCVSPDQREPLSEKIRGELLALKGPDGRQAVQQVSLQKEAFDGPLTEYGPDLLVGYAPGYRASSQTGLGSWEDDIFESNSDHWGADHCIAPDAVPGVLFCNQGLANFPHPSYRDIPALSIGKNVEKRGAILPPPTSGNEDQEIVEERLKSLGYL